MSKRSRWGVYKIRSRAHMLHKMWLKKNTYRLELLHQLCVLSVLPSTVTQQPSLFYISAPKTGQCLTDMMSVPLAASTSFDEDPF